MELKFGQYVPAGFSISVTSWENDGDDYRTETIHGLTKNEVNDWIKVLSLFSHAVDDLGNNDYNAGQTFEALIESGISKQFALKHLGVELPSEDDSEEETQRMWDKFESNQYELMDKLQEVLSSPVQYDCDFMRMVDSVTVYEFEEEFTMPAAPEPLRDFDMSYWKKPDIGTWVV